MVFLKTIPDETRRTREIISLFNTEREYSQHNLLVDSHHSASSAE